MKKFLFLTFVLLSLFARAQSPLTFYEVASIQQLKTYYGQATGLHVASTNEFFTLYPTGIADDSTIYAGAAGRKWRKVKSGTGDVTLSTAQELQNKTIDADKNAVKNISPANMKAGAAEEIQAQEIVAEEFPFTNPQFQGVIKIGGDTAATKKDLRNATAGATAGVGDGTVTVAKLATGSTVDITADLAGKEPSLGNPAANGYFLQSTTAGVRTWTPAPTGVSSIAINTPAVTYNTPVNLTNNNGNWTGTLSLINQAANTVFAGPASGAAATPGWRSLAAADIPSLDAAKITTGTIAPARLGSGTANSTTVLYGDGTYKAAPTGGSGSPYSDYVRRMRSMGSPILASANGVGNPSELLGTYAMSNGGGLIIPVSIFQNETINGAMFYLAGAAVVTTWGTAFNGALLYKDNGDGTNTLVAQSANSTGIWTATANATYQIPFTSAYSATAGNYNLVLVYTATTATTAPSILSTAFVTNTPKDLFFGNSKVLTARTTGVSWTSGPAPAWTWGTNTVTETKMTWGAIY